jgi:DNA polymerase
MAATLNTSAADYLPQSRSLTALKRAARVCKGCHLYRRATQTVFGAGKARAKLMLVGEQPGDVEDQQGKPFVGPAGRLLDELLEEAGIADRAIYVTNAVKHFKWTPHGKRRLHSKPNSRELAACRPWLDAELSAVEPKLVVCLGATAAQQLLGPQFRITKSRGKIVHQNSLAVLATYHPSAILRAPGEYRSTMRQQLADDLKFAQRYLRSNDKQPLSR